ncbi:hypothetical protein EC396_08700 [Lutibacter sp. HS1-25]|uniref:hypothetical protein n=1 Tax=Lutibacter sp. HS1-25 TaxID=2485000 RepID=UPI0010100C10|nr:hypothetical protein [Lutibacter sp. HS1-25]RXP54783.1 hypothetical protein EC396_08700 [Lutibacter sp. HS1-25]
MKNLTLGIIFLLFTTILVGQNSKENLKNDFNDYLTLILNEEIEKSMDYLIDDFFKIIPKEQLIVLMKQIYNNPSYEFKLTTPKILSIGDIETINDKSYSILTYSSLMNMKFNSDSENETTDDKNARLNLIRNSLVSTFGVENVKLDDETDFFEILATKSVCSLSENGIDNWKFITVEEKQKSLLEQFIPKEIMEKI